jgi:hypothetical protein
VLPFNRITCTQYFLMNPAPMLKQKIKEHWPLKARRQVLLYSLSMCCFAEKNICLCASVCVCMCVFTNQYYMIVGAYIVASKDSQSTRQQQSVNRGGGGGV